MKIQGGKASLSSSTFKEINKSPLYNSLFHSNPNERSTKKSSLKLIFEYTLKLDLRIQTASSSVTNMIQRKEEEHEEEIYVRAGVKQQHQIALGDFIGGGSLIFNHLMDILCLEYFQNNFVGIMIKCGSTFVPKIIKNWIILDLSSHFWFEEELDNATESTVDEASKYYSNMSNLQRTYEKILEILGEIFATRQIPIVFDSISPLVLFHGIQATLHFLNKLSATPHCDLLIVPITFESIPPQDLKILEDSFSNAIITIQQGTCHLVRQSRRGTGKLVRDAFPYQIVKNNELFFVAEEKKGKKEQASEPVSVINNRRKKIDIQMNEGQREEKLENIHVSSSSNQKANIFLEDDDPDFDDWDEEDPDDDLDI